MALGEKQRTDEKAPACIIKQRSPENNHFLRANGEKKKKKKKKKKKQPEDRQQAVVEEPTHGPSDDISYPRIPPLDVFLFSFSLASCLSLS